MPSPDNIIELNIASGHVKQSNSMTRRFTKCRVESILFARLETAANLCYSMMRYFIAWASQGRETVLYYDTF